MPDSRPVLVTGAAKRLGRAIALDLANHGWDIALHYSTSEADACETAAQIRGVNRKAALLKADLGNEDEAAGLIRRATAELGAVSALVNCASIFERDEWATVTRESWDRHMAVNLRAPFVLSQEFARALPENARGTIVNIIDQRVLKPTPQFLSYSLSKAGLYWLNTTLAQALAPRVRVNAVAPGPTMINARQSEADFRRQREATVLGTGAEPQDVCDAVRYLLTASVVTGQMIAVDGGQHLIWQTPDVTGVE
ncbi:MAG TPA: SDR family oxidoreductase [Rhizomicrobium sp.]|jgi:NAD(P)-dependent dehydrogenase (short-subunit alcohol dehydrogenase family)|nr:SDR family oxidoreductase [Rhizomicrobium sp.]